MGVMFHADSMQPAHPRAVTGRAIGVSVVLHGVGLLIVLALMTMSPQPVIDPARVAETHELVFARATGPMGGGGTGGNAMPAPARRLEMTGTPPAPPAVEPVATPPPPALLAPVSTVNPLIPTMGVIAGLSAAPSRGPGSGDGAGSGPGAGAGGGDGPGVGSGSDGGTGGGPMGPGSGATPPSVLRSVDPTYTTAAMHAKVQGTVVLEVLVTAAGTVGDVKVIGSLDKLHGLDAQAVATARKWLFRPARFQGKPVAYVVNLHLVFNLR